MQITSFRLNKIYLPADWLDEIVKLAFQEMREILGCEQYSYLHPAKLLSIYRQTFILIKGEKSKLADLLALFKKYNKNWTTTLIGSETILWRLVDQHINVIKEFLEKKKCHELSISHNISFRERSRSPKPRDLPSNNLKIENLEVNTQRKPNEWYSVNLYYDWVNPAQIFSENELGILSEFSYSHNFQIIISPCVFTHESFENSSFFSEKLKNLFLRIRCKLEIDRIFWVGDISLWAKKAFNLLNKNMVDSDLKAQKKKLEQYDNLLKLFKN